MAITSGMGDLVEVGPRRFETVVDEMLQMIDDRGLEPGDRLPTERDLAGEFGVSRSVMRQAFGILEERGIIHTRRGSGRYLRQAEVPAKTGARSRVEIASIADVLEARGLLENQIAQLACDRRTSGEARDLTALAAKLDGWEDNVAFHRALASCTHNFMLERMTKELVDLSGELHQRAHYNDSDQLERMRGEHMGIAAAVEARDVEMTEQLVAAHLKGTSRLLHGLSTGR